MERLAILLKIENVLSYFLNPHRINNQDNRWNYSGQSRSCRLAIRVKIILSKTFYYLIFNYVPL